MGIRRLENWRVSEEKNVANVLRDQAAIMQAIHDIAPLSSLGEHLAAAALRAEAARLEHKP